MTERATAAKRAGSRRNSPAAMVLFWLGLAALTACGDPPQSDTQPVPETAGEPTDQSSKQAAATRARPDGIPDEGPFFPRVDTIGDRRLSDLCRRLPPLSVEDVIHLIEHGEEISSRDLSYLHPVYECTLSAEIEYKDKVVDISYQVAGMGWITAGRFSPPLTSRSFIYRKCEIWGEYMRLADEVYKINYFEGPTDNIQPWCLDDVEPRSPGPDPPSLSRCKSDIASQCVA